MSRKAALTATNKMVTGVGTTTITKLLKGVAVSNLDEGVERTLGGLLKSKVQILLRWNSGVPGYWKVGETFFENQVLIYDGSCFDDCLGSLPVFNAY